jgi:hypothetical protein
MLVEEGGGRGAHEACAVPLVTVEGQHLVNPRQSVFFGPVSSYMRL